LVEQAQCDASSVSATGCKITLTKLVEGNLRLELRVIVSSPQAYDSASVTVPIDFSLYQAPDEVLTTSVAEGTTPDPVCAPVAPRQMNYAMGSGSLTGHVVTQSFPTSSFSKDGRTVVLTADGAGALLIGLEIEGRSHDPCVRGQIDQLTFRIAASGREGDRGNVAIRPALFVEESTYLASPLTIARGSRVDEMVTLSSSDFIAVGNSPPLDLVSGPAIRFGVVVGISCPATSTCGQVDRSVTIEILDVVAN